MSLQQRSRSAVCSPWPWRAVSGRQHTHAHLLRRLSCLCLTHRLGDMCRPVPMGHRAFLRVR
eukprot:6791750-Prymnesium_polylepis.1